MIVSSCKVIGLGHIERISQLAWAIQKESTFAEAFYYNINKLKEIGSSSKNNEIFQAYQTFFYR